MSTNKRNVVVLPEKFKDHARENLAAFIGNPKVFKADEDKQKAESIYRDLLQMEHDLKSHMAAKFKPAEKEPPKSFDLKAFSDSVKDNIITTAIKANFVKDPRATKAGWEYYTLKKSVDALKDIPSNASKQNPSDEKSQTSRSTRFGPEAGAKNQQLLDKGNVTSITVTTQPTGQPKKGATGQSSSHPPGATAAPQAEVENVEMVEDHLVNAHLHGIFPHLPHPEEPPSEEEKEEDAKSSILHLLWAHQDYFDQKALSRAQAEYSYYRGLKRQWKHTTKRVKMDDIKLGKFDIKEFYGLPRNRPLYAAILTILEQSRERGQAETAAEEYYKLKVLEKTMWEQKMITELPQGIELDQAHSNELFQDMKTRFKSSGRQAQIRQPTEFKMIPLFEYYKLKETITHQRNQIEELASRLSGIASQQLADGGAGFTDLGDKNRPQKLGEKFAELFDETWSSAYESLKPKQVEGQGDEDENDEKTMETLQNIVKEIYEFCLKVSQEQLSRLINGMTPPITNPLSNGTPEDMAASVLPPPAFFKTKTEQMAQDYRKAVAPATVAVLQKEILENHIKGKLLADPISKELEAYVNQCTDLIWYMSIQQPPMEIAWAKPGEKFNREQFRFSGKKGKTFKLTVWPAVFLHKDGPLVAQGYAVPE